MLFSGSRPRQIWRNGAKKKTAGEIAGVLPSVLFCPEDLMVLKTGAAPRRRLVDLALLTNGKLKINGCLACEYCHGKGNGACVQKDDMQELYPLLAEAEVLVIASPVYYFTLSAQIQAPIQRMYAPFKPAKVKKMVLLLSSNSPNVYDGAIGQYKGMCTFFKFEDAGIVTAKANEQKTEATREKILELVKKL